MSADIQVIKWWMWMMMTEPEPTVCTLTFDGDTAIATAKALLAQHDYVVLKAKSYRAAQERQRTAEALRWYADQRRESTERWAQTTLHNEIRELMARCTFLYGAARARGATVDELAGGWATTGINCPKCGGD